MLIAKSSRSDGFAIVVGPYGEYVEMDTLKCNHCQCIIFLVTIGGKEPQWGHCHNCQGVVCEGCYNRILEHGCEYFLKQIEKLEEADYVRRNRGY